MPGFFIEMCCLGNLMMSSFWCVVLMLYFFNIFLNLMGCSHCFWVCMWRIMLFIIGCSVYLHLGETILLECQCHFSNFIIFVKLWAYWIHNYPLNWAGWLDVTQRCLFVSCRDHDGILLSSSLWTVTLRDGIV